MFFNKFVPPVGLLGKLYWQNIEISNWQESNSLKFVLLTWEVRTIENSFDQKQTTRFTLQFEAWFGRMLAFKKILQEEKAFSPLCHIVSLANCPAKHCVWWQLRLWGYGAMHVYNSIEFWIWICFPGFELYNLILLHCN